MEYSSEIENDFLLADLEKTILLRRKLEFRLSLLKLSIRLDLIVINGKSLFQFLVELEYDQYQIIKYLELLNEEFDERYSTEKGFYIKKAIDFEVNNSTALAAAVRLKKNV